MNRLLQPSGPDLVSNRHNTSKVHIFMEKRRHSANASVWGHPLPGQGVGALPKATGNNRLWQNLSCSVWEGAGGSGREVEAVEEATVIGMKVYRSHSWYFSRGHVHPIISMSNFDAKKCRCD